MSRIGTDFEGKWALSYRGHGRYVSGRSGVLVADAGTIGATETFIAYRTGTAWGDPTVVLALPSSGFVMQGECYVSRDDHGPYSACPLQPTADASGALSLVTANDANGNWFFPPLFGVITRNPSPQVGTYESSTTDVAPIDVVVVTPARTRLHQVGGHPDGDFSYADLSGLDFSHLDLHGSNFLIADLAGTDFTGANLAGCNFILANLAGTIFAGANLAKATFTWTAPAGTDFSGCDLSGAVLSNAQSHLGRLDLRTARFSAASRLDGANLAEADLKGVSLAGASLARATLDGALLAETDLTGSNLSGASFATCDVTGTTFSAAPEFGTDYTHRTSFARARLNLSTIALQWSYLDLTQATIVGLAKGTDLTGLQGLYCVLTGVDLTDVVLHDALFDHAVFAGTSLSRADLSGASLRFAALLKANLVGVNLDHANLTGAQLGGQDKTVAANLAFAYLNGTVADHANLFGVSLSAATVIGCSFASTTTMELVDLAGAYLEDVDLSNAALNGAKLDGACLLACTFTGADLTPAVSGSIVTSLDSACLHGSQFANARLEQADLTNAVVAFTPGALTTSYCGPGGQRTSPYPMPYNATAGLDLKVMGPSTICPNGSTVAENQSTGLSLAQMLTTNRVVTAWTAAGCGPSSPG